MALLVIIPSAWTPYLNQLPGRELRQNSKCPMKHTELARMLSFPTCDGKKIKSKVWMDVNYRTIFLLWLYVAGLEGQTKKSDVVRWFMDEFERDATADEFIIKSDRLRKIIDRMAKVDGVIIYVQSEALEGMDAEGAVEGLEETTAEDPVILVHPNYSGDSAE